MLRGRLQIVFTPDDGGRPRTLDCRGTLSTLLDRLLVFVSDLVASTHPASKKKRTRAR